jgi:Zn finger protein HypA/HybF involved in hydrogenase expression
MIDEWDYFYTLVRPKETVKKVKCIGCRKVFKGTAGRRRCSACRNQKLFIKSGENI